MRGRILRALVALCSISLLVGTVGGEAEGKRAERRIGALVAPVRLVPTSDDPVAVFGLNSFLGAVELDSAGDGLVVSNRLGLERYVLGLNEVPTDWPEEALEAQAVAARTYALWTLNNGRAGDAAVYGFDICASVECQVYSGADVLASEGGARWAEAVEATEGEVVLHEGEPILARYHSVSGGRTFDNPDVFPGEPDYPYLRSVPSETEEASPLDRWRVEFPVFALRSMLERGGWWERSQGPLVDVRTIPSRSGSPYPDVVVKGRGGRLVRSADELRDLVRELAPEMFPLRYPSFAATPSGRLPETLPSERVRISTSRDVVVVLGRGWGHGTGMSQWGAHGMAERGASHEEILTHYYSGVELGRVRTQGPIEVGVDWARSSARVSGAFRIVDGTGRTIVRRGLGTWDFSWGGSGAVKVDPPRGFYVPLEVGIVDAPERVDVGEAVRLTIALSRPARVHTTSAEDRGGPDPEVREAGRSRVLWLAPPQPGSYAVQVRASTGAVERASEPVEVVVEEQPGGTDPPGGASGEPSSGRSGAGAWPLVAVGLLVVVAAGAVVFVGTIGR
ncbi:MAG: SpoIID/LytB domain-containing protein [Actinomycetota bacterium]